MTLVRLLFAIELAFLAVSAQFDVSKCGGEKFCEREPRGCKDESECSMLFSSKPLGEDQVEFELWAPSKLANGQKLNYLAIGFSDDTKMGGEGVTYCYSVNDDSTKGVGIGKTVGKSFTPAENEGNAKLEELSVENGNFYCKFTQNVNKGSEDLLKPDLSKNYHILVVRGTASDKSSLNIHSFSPSESPFASGAKIELTAALTPPEAETPTESNDAGDVNLAAVKPETKKTSDESQETATKNSETSELSFETRQTLQRLHGSLMLIAWFGFVLSAIFSARYLRDYWPNTTISGLNLWFHIHRLLNVLGVLLIVASVILIFVGTKFQWTGPVASATRDENLAKGAIHSLVGVISVILAIFQPFMAMMRCDKHDSKRPIFNVFHRSFGLLGVLLAVIAVGIAVIGRINGFFSTNHTLSTGLLIAFFVFAILVIIAQEYIRIREAQERQKVTAIEMQTRSSPAPSNSYYYKNQTVYSSRYRHTTLFLFVIFGSVSFAVSVLLTYLVWAN